MRRTSVITIVLTAIFCCFLPSECLASENTQDDIALLIDVELENLSLGEWQQMADSGTDLWGDRSLEELVRDMATGKGYDAEAVFSGVSAVLTEKLRARFFIVSLLMALSLVGGLTRETRPDGQRDGVASLACYALTILVAVYAFASAVSAARQAVDAAVRVMELAFPVLMTLLTAGGAAASVGLLKPAAAVLTGTVSQVFSSVVLPAVLAMGVTSSMGNMSGHKTLDRLTGFLKSAVKWVTGGLSTLYIGAVSILGIAAKSADGLSIRATRYVADKFVPYVGSIVSGSVDALLLVSSLVKNALGACAVLIMAGVMLSPILEVATLQIAFRLAAALMEPIADERVTKGVSALADVLACLFGVLAAVAVMFALTVGIAASAGSALL